MIFDDEKLYSASNLIEATEDSKVALNLVFIAMQNLCLSKGGHGKSQEKTRLKCMHVCLIRQPLLSFF